MQINTLQILRAFAAISVLITHVFQKSNFKPFGGYFLSGQYGVDIFFVLSGFLIYLTTKEQTNPWKYLKKRVFRIYPLYLFALLFYILYLINFQDFKLDFKTLVQNILMLPWDTKWSYKSLIVGVAWSTLFEMFFYSLFFLLLFSKVQKIFIFVLIPLLFLICFSLIRFTTIENNIPFVSLFVSLAGSIHMIFFLAGCIIGELFIKNRIPKLQKNGYTFILFGSFVFMIMTMLMPYYHTLSFFACILLFISVLQYESYFSLDINKRSTAFMIYMGDISYSIYIFHVLVISVLIIWIKNIPALLAVTILITLIISSFTYNYIEKKFIALGKK
ncbi:acyltransferase family protein [Chryseobacterium hispalense]|uniref:acyltransferase family protein n=1 Tax=Chryseobacterium hispalense TaxID=1453492 RepID=UPI0039190F7D